MWTINTYQSHSSPQALLFIHNLHTMLIFYVKKASLPATVPTRNTLITLLFIHSVVFITINEFFWPTNFIATLFFYISYIINYSWRAINFVVNNSVPSIVLMDDIFMVTCQVLLSINPIIRQQALNNIYDQHFRELNKFKKSRQNKYYTRT